MQNAEQIICVNPCNLWLTYDYGNSSAFIGAFASNGSLYLPDFTSDTTNTFRLWVDDWSRTNATVKANLHYDSTNSFEMTLHRQPDGKCIIRVRAEEYP